MRRTARASALALAFLVAGTARGRPVEESTRIGIFVGPRYVPHAHFEQEAAGSNDRVLDDWKLSPEALASFAYRPEAALEVSLELGYAADSFTLQSGILRVASFPLLVSVRFAPWGGAVYPYVGAGGGYMLNFLSGAPSGQTEGHTRTFHALGGVAWDLATSPWTFFIEDRIQYSNTDVVPIGELGTGGNALMVGLSYRMAPEPSDGARGP